MKAACRIAGFLLLASTCVSADVLDFEDAAAFGGDDAIISSKYFLSQGFDLSAVAGDSAETAREVDFSFEKVGKDGTDGFVTKGLGRDVARTGDLGNYFLKAGTGNLEYNKAKYFKLSVDYTTVSFGASGQIWDIDGPEQYQVTAFDASGALISTLTSPAGGLDGEPWDFSIAVDPTSGRIIDKIDIEAIGTKNLRGFAFDNFDSHATPLPAGMSLSLMGLVMVAFRGRQIRQRDSKAAAEATD
jgi:hypothetical protein